jgi:hypothetical protein
LEADETAFGGNVDYGMLVKIYGNGGGWQRRARTDRI